MPNNVAAWSFSCTHKMTVGNGSSRRNAKNETQNRRLYNIAMRYPSPLSTRSFDLGDTSLIHSTAKSLLCDPGTIISSCSVQASHSI